MSEAASAPAAAVVAKTGMSMAAKIGLGVGILLVLAAIGAVIYHMLAGRGPAAGEVWFYSECDFKGTKTVVSVGDHPSMPYKSFRVPAGHMVEVQEVDADGKPASTTKYTSDVTCYDKIHAGKSLRVVVSKQ